ncbi:ribbon-helix-helix domain-containing protein [Haloarcula salinisoli]|uniref:Ribbon-helix-helix domain-containing protein n=1 Tax=Haloarcula salinisoli TaxID=2487746 RepID=A0A8J8CBH5_9EURY|nr:ribbon-helix-helix domain-containing protein [Halomicroarcula salinisoli]MBX0304318.1 ribbon-helix-helix domain-containing protein [Halomicroarcula salinisoli]
MSSSTDSQGGSTKIAVRVPSQLVDRIDAEYEDRGYTSRSEAIRDALRAWVGSAGRRSEAADRSVETGREQRDSLDELVESYGGDIYE